MRRAGALLLALSGVGATLVSAATVTPLATAASLRTPPLPVTAHLTPSSFAEVIVALTAATPEGFRSDFLSIGTLRGEEAKRGSNEGCAGELNRLTARDCAALKTPRQVVEGAKTSSISLHQQRMLLLSLSPGTDPKQKQNR